MNPENAITIFFRPAKWHLCFLFHFASTRNEIRMTSSQTYYRVTSFEFLALSHPPRENDRELANEFFISIAMKRNTLQSWKFVM